MAFRVEEVGQFRGQVTFLDIILPALSVGNAQVKEAAGIKATKLEHQHRAVYTQASATTAAADARVVHVVKGTAGTIKSFEAGCVVACIGDSTITVDLKVNGASILVAPISLSVAQAAYVLVAATISDDVLAADDVLEVVTTATIGTGTLGLGLFAYADIHEDES